MTVLAIADRKTNGDLIAECAELGYLDKDWLTLDATYGEGVFWSVFRPRKLIANSIRNGGHDFTKMPYATGLFDVVVFDPPYKLNGTPDEVTDRRYGVEVPTSIADRHWLMERGLVECIRVTKPGGYLLVKCQDQVASGRVWWQTDLMTMVATEMGCTKVDALLFPSYRPQPEGRRQVHARRNYSTLLILRKGKA